MESFLDQEKLIKSSQGLFTFILRLLTGLLMGTTLALVINQLMGYAPHEGTTLFILILILTLGSFWRISRAWSWTGVLVFDLVVVAVALLLRMYVMVAPNL